MPGFRDSNLRSGDQNERFGLDRLSEFAFIAPVPRPEDVGIDAVATIFRRFRRQLFAEDSCVVQAKSASVRSIKFDEVGVNWLRSQVLPFYVLSANRIGQVVELYSIGRATGHPNFRDRKRLALHLDQTQMNLDGDGMEIWIGPPILKWTPTQAATRAFQSKAYKILKTWVTFETASVSLRQLSMTRLLQWKTNQVPTYRGDFAIMGGPGELRASLESMKPHIYRLIAEVFPPEKTSINLIGGLLYLCEYMRENGVDPDPSALLPKLVAHYLEANAAGQSSTSGKPTSAKMTIQQTLELRP